MRVGGTAHCGARIKPIKAPIEPMRGDGEARHGTVMVLCRSERPTLWTCSESLQAEMVHSIVGAFFDVYNYFGYGFNERVYGGALAHELRERGTPSFESCWSTLRYKGRSCRNATIRHGRRRPLDRRKQGGEKLTSADRMQLVNYLARNQFEVGLLLHFGPTASFERFFDHPKRERPHGHRHYDPRMIRFVFHSFHSCPQ